MMKSMMPHIPIDNDFKKKFSTYLAYIYDGKNIFVHVVRKKLFPQNGKNVDLSTSSTGTHTEGEGGNTKTDMCHAIDFNSKYL